MFIMRERIYGRSWEFKWSLLHWIILFILWNDATAQIRYSIPEELDHGAFVGNVAKDLGLDIKKLQDRSFRIVSGSRQRLLQVNQNSGVLFVNQNIDREQLCEKNIKCHVDLKIVLENPLEIHYVQVEINDANDNAPVFPVNQTRLEIAEYTLQGARFPLEGAHDPDVGINSLRSYILSQNEHFKIDIQDLSEDSKVPVLILQKPLDREVDAAHNLFLTAFDGGDPQRSGTLGITVHVLDSNDNPPVFDQQIYQVLLQENAAKGKRVIQLNASDLDEDLNGEIMYGFGKINNEKITELFSLDTITGEMKVAGLIDFEEKQIYEIDVQAIDKSASPLAAHCRVVVQIQDVNDNAPEIELISKSNTISEDLDPGSIIALISVTDLDSGVNGQVTCLSSANVPFELKASVQRNVYSLVTNAPLDREVASQYTITITAKDFGVPPLSSQITITVIVSDINDNIPSFAQSAYTLYIPENNAPGASIFTVRAFDPDQNQNARISYAILGSQVQHMPISSFLSINSDNGNIYALRSFDFELLKNFQFQVEAKDFGVPSLSSNVTVDVFILDQNDNAPVILSPLPKNGTAVAVETIPRNVNAGYLVTRIRAYDADLGYNAWLSFSLQEATDPRLFTVGIYTGGVRTRYSFTESDPTLHELIIFVKDSGNNSLSTTVTIHIAIAEDTVEPLFYDLKRTTKKQDEKQNLTFYLIIILGSVSSLFIVSIVVLVVIQCHKPRNSLDSRYSCHPNYAEVSGNGVYQSYQYRMSLNTKAVPKDFVLVEPNSNVGAAMDVGSNGNTLLISDIGWKASGQVSV